MNSLMHINSLKNGPSEAQALKLTVMQRGGPAGSGPVNTSQTVLSRCSLTLFGETSEGCQVNSFLFINHCRNVRVA